LHAALAASSVRAGETVRPHRLAWEFLSESSLTMRRIAILAALSLLILLLTKIANQVPADAPPGAAFSLKAQKVVQCSEGEITLVDNHFTATHLDKDSSWPDCSDFGKDDAFDFYLSQGERTHFLSQERTAWWRRAM